MNRNARGPAWLLLERLEDRLAPAAFDYSSGTLTLSTGAVGATMDVYKSGPTQIQVVLGAADDVWQGTDGSALGITGNGLTTLTVDTSLYTGGIGINSGTGDPTPETLTFHGTSANGPLPAIEASWGILTGDVGNIVFTGGTVAFGGDSDVEASGAITVNSPITVSGSLSFSANGDITVNAAITAGLQVGGGITIRGGNTTINAPVQTAPIATTAEWQAASEGVGNIAISTAQTLSLNALVATGQIGIPDNPLGQGFGGASGEIDVGAATVVGNVHGELSTGSAYLLAYGLNGVIGFGTGGVNISATGDISLAAPVAISTGDAINYPNLMTGGGGNAYNGGILLFTQGNISADGATGQMNLHFGLAEGSSGGQLFPEPSTTTGVNTEVDGLNLGYNGPDSVGPGNIYLACTGYVALDLTQLGQSQSAPRTVDVTTVGGDMLAFISSANLYGDNVDLGAGTGKLTLLGSVDFGAGNVTFTADEIDVVSYFNLLDDGPPSSIAGTGALLLQPASPGRNIAIGGDNTLDSALNLSDNDLAAFAPGFKSITIGRASDGTGTVDILDNQSFVSPTTIYGGSFTGQGVSSVTTTSGDNLTLHAHTGSIGGAASTTNVYSTTVDSVPDILPDLGCFLPAGSHFSAQVDYSADASDGGGPVFTVLIDGVPALTETGPLGPPSGPPGFEYLGYGSVDLEVDVPVGGAPVPTLHQITVSVAPAFLMGISSQSVTTTIPGGGGNDPIDATAGGTLNLISDASNGAGNIYVLSNHSLTLQQNAFATTGPGRNTISLQTSAGDITVPSSEPSVLTDNLYLNAAGSLNIPAGWSPTAPVLSFIAGAALNLDPTQLYTTTVGDLTLKSGTTSIGTPALPLDVNVAGDLNLHIAGNAFITSATPLVLGGIYVGQTFTATTSSDGMTIAGGGGAGGAATLTSAGPLVVDGGLSAGSMVVTAPSITGTGGLSSSGNMMLDATAGGIGTADSLLSLAAGNLTATAAGPMVLGDITVNQDLTATTSSGGMTFAVGGTVGGTAILTSPGPFVVDGGLKAGSMTVTAPSITGTGSLSSSGNMTLDAITGGIGTAGGPLPITAGNLTANAAGPMFLGEVTVGQTLIATTSSGGMTLADGGSVGGTATLTSAAVFVDDGPFAAGVLVVTAAGSITGTGILTTSGTGNMTLDATTGGIGTASTLLEIAIGGDLNATADGSIYLVSLQSLTVLSLTSTPDQTVTVTGTDGLTTLFSAGLTDDTVTLDGGTGGLTMQLPSGPPLDFGNGAVTLVGDTMTLAGPADSLKGTGPLNVQAYSSTQPITIGGTTGLGVDLTTSSLNALAPGFGSISIGRADFANPVSIGGNATFTSPTTIIASGFTDAAQGVVATTNSVPLTLHALTGSIGSALGSLLVNVGGIMDLITDALKGVGSIFVNSAHSLTLGQNQNVAVTTALGSSDAVDLATSAGGITVNRTFTSSDNWTLQSAGDLTIFPAVTITTASLDLNAGGALVTSFSHGDLLRTTLGNMTLACAKGSIGTSAFPAKVRVAAGGSLNIITSSPNLGSADAYVTSTDKLNVGSLSTGAAGSIVNIASTSPNGVTLSTTNTLNANVTISSAGPVALTYKGTFEAGSITINASGSKGSISGHGILATSSGDMTLNSGAGIGTSTVPLSVNVVGGDLNVQATGDINITSPVQDLIISGVSDPGSNNVLVSTTGGGLLSTLSGSGLNVAGDTVALNGGTGGLFLGVQGGLDIGNGSLTLIGDTITLVGPANSLTGSGDVTLQPFTPGRAITLGRPAGGPGLDLTAASLSVFASGLDSINIGYDGTNPVTTAGPVTFTSPTYIYGSAIGDASDDNGSNVVTTTNSADLSLEAAVGDINANVNVSGNLYLTTDTTNEGGGSINVVSMQPLSVGSDSAVDNTILSTSNEQPVSLTTTSSLGISVPETFSDSNDLTLKSAGDITIPDDVTLEEASLTLIANGALSTGTTTQLITDTGNMTLACNSGGIGATSTLNVTVAGTLTVLSGATDQVQISSPASLTLGKIETGHGATVLFSSTGGDLVLSAGNLLFGQVALEASSHLLLGDGDPFQAGSFIVVTHSGISGSRPLQANAAAFANGAPGAFLVHNVSGDIGNATTPVEIDSLAGGSANIICNSGNVYVHTSGTLPVGNVSAGSGAASLVGGNFVATNNAALAGDVELQTGTTLDSVSYNIDINHLTINQGTVISSGGGSIIPTAGTVMLGGNLSGVTGLVDVEGSAEVDGDSVNLAPDVQSGELAIEAGSSVGTVTISPGAGIDVSQIHTPATQASAVAILTNGSLNIDPLILNTTKLALNAGSTLNLLSNSGTTPGSGYDHIVVSGPVSIAATANLNFTFATGFTPSAGTVFDIIQNTGGSPVSGTFNGLPEGGVFTSDGVSLQISYVGGTSGQDVTLTVVGAPPTVTGTMPSLAGGTLAAGTTSLQVAFSEAVIGADQAGNYQLQTAGPDGVLGTADDITLPITSVSYSGDTATLNFAPLAEGLYRLTVDGTITDPTGIGLDGTGAGTSGVNNVTDFVTTPETTDQFNSPSDSFNVLPGNLGAGELVGYDGAGYDAISDLQVDGTEYAPTGPATFGGSSQDLLTAVETMSGLSVSREVTVPTTGSQNFARTIEQLQNPTGGDITATVTLISNLGTEGAAGVFATASGDVTPSPADQWVGTQSPGGPAIVHYVHGPADLTPTTISVVGDSIEWTYSVTVPAGQTVELGELTVVNGTQAGAISDANALVASTGFGGDAGDFLSAGDLAAIANFQFVAPPLANAGGPYTLQEGSALVLDGSQSSDAAGYPLTYSWTINGVANAATGVQPTLTYAQVLALGLGLGSTCNVTLQVRDGQGGSNTSTTTLSVVVGDPVKLVFEPTSNNATAGKTIPTFNVDVLDQLGTLVSTDTSAVTIAIATPSGATFSAGTLSVAVGNGVASFGDLVLDQAGTYTITATDGNLTPAISATFTISPDVAHQLAFETTTNDAVAGQTIPAFEVNVEDQYGNLVTSDTSTVTVAIDTGPAGGSITAGTLSVPAAGGVALFSDLDIQMAGTYTLAATDGNLMTADSDSFTIDPDAAAALSFENTSNNALSGQIIPAFKVDVLDQYGNLVTTGTSVVSVGLNSDPPDQQFAAGTASQAAVGGVATFNDLMIQGSGTYSLSAGDGFLSPALSNTFTVATPLQVTLQPASQTVFVGQSATLTAASANPSDAVQWEVNKNDSNGFTDIPGATATTLTITDATPTENGYECEAVFTNTLLSGSLASSPATLTVDFVATAPVSAAINTGQTATFTAASSDPVPDSVQWQVNQNDGNGFTDVAGATTTTLSLIGVTPSQNGYLYRAVFVNPIGTLTTPAATLTVDFLNVTSDPANQSITYGETASFIATAAANPAATVQWQVNRNDGNGFTNIPGATATTLTLTEPTVAMTGYQFRAVFTTIGVNSTVFTATTESATLGVSQATPSFGNLST
ncbi:MAG TPA: PKD domain-containing protein, partial [Chloroflexota bacterium]|nr:PKD domain-containing protein [Chloroflexota bacterium]